MLFLGSIHNCFIILKRIFQQIAIVSYQIKLHVIGQPGPLTHCPSIDLHTDAWVIYACMHMEQTHLMSMAAIGFYDS